MKIEEENPIYSLNTTRLVSLNDLIDRISIFAPSDFYSAPSAPNRPTTSEAHVPSNCVAAALRGMDLMPSLGNFFDEKYAQEILQRHLEAELRRSWAAQQLKNWQDRFLKQSRSISFWRSSGPDGRNADPIKTWGETQKLLTAHTAATNDVIKILKTGKSEGHFITQAFRSMASNGRSHRFIEISMDEEQALSLMHSLLPPIIEINAQKAAPLISSDQRKPSPIKDSRFSEGALAAILTIVKQKNDFHNCSADELRAYIKEKLNDMSEMGDGKFYAGIKNREYQFFVKNTPESYSSKKLNTRIESVLQVLSKSIFPAPAFAAELKPRHKIKSS